MNRFVSDIKIDGEIYDYDPKTSTALVPCDNCGHINEVDVTKEGDKYVLSSFSCENCGHWNSFD